MEEKGYKNRWLVPKSCVKYGTWYHDKLVENIPEFVLLDKCLNEDIMTYLYKYVAIIAYLLKNDP